MNAPLPADPVTPPDTDLRIGQVHLCTLRSGARILVRDDMVVIWLPSGEQASMTPEQWLEATR